MRRLLSTIAVTTSAATATAMVMFFAEGRSSAIATAT